MQLGFLGVWASLPFLAHALAAESEAAAAASSATQNSASTAIRAKENPAIARYRELAQHYAQDAKEAEEGALTWSERSRALAYGGGGVTQRHTRKALKLRGVRAFARRVWDVEKTMRDPRPVKAEKMALKAEAPYLKALNEYTLMKMSYASTAQGYEARSQSDLSLARDLFGYARQYQLEGNPDSEANFDHASKMLFNQAKQMKGTGDGYIAKAEVIGRTLPVIQDMAKAARSYAAWQENPEGVMPPQQVYTATVAPPSMPAVQPGTAMAPIASGSPTMR